MPVTKACWKPLEGIDLPAGADGTPAKDDFVDGALHKCGVGMIVWATAFAYDKSAFGDSVPAKIADFFDTDTFPGPRAIRNDPTVIMEWGTDRGRCRSQGRLRNPGNT